MASGGLCRDGLASLVWIGDFIGKPLPRWGLKAAVMLFFGWVLLYLVFLVLGVFR